MKKNIENFTDQEKEVYDLINRLHEKYYLLPEQCPEDLEEWKLGVRYLQKILSIRILRREYPGMFKIME